MSARPPERLRVQLALFVFVRLVINTAYRLFYPFLAVFARGLGVGLAELSYLFALRSLLGAALAPLAAPFADRRGRKAAMALGLGMFALGSGLVALRPEWPFFVAAILLTHFGNMVFLPAMQAYLGDRVPFQIRGRAMAATELSWSLAFMLGVPLVGLLLATWGWTAVFPLLSAAALLGLGLFLRLIPADAAAPRAAGQAAGRSAAWQLFTAPPVLAALGVSLLITVANELVNLVFGLWMEDSFGLKIAALGAASLVIGLAELGGEGAAALWVDRLGKIRAVQIGILLAGAASLLLPILGRSLPGAVVGLFLFFLGFEFTVVCYIPLISAVMPGARATFMAANLAAFSLGRSLGSLAGGWLYPQGIWANALAALVLYAFSLVLLQFVRLKE